MVYPETDTDVSDPTDDYFISHALSVVAYMSGNMYMYVYMSGSVYMYVCMSAIFTPNLGVSGSVYAYLEVYGNACGNV